MQSHFELDASQILYLEQIDQGWINNAANETKYALENRQSITLQKELTRSSEEEEDDKDRGKLLDLDKKKNSSYSKTNGFSETETLVYTISYTII